jgi:hypothetical protein
MATYPTLTVGVICPRPKKGARSNGVYGLRGTLELVGPVDKSHLKQLSDAQRATVTADRGWREDDFSSFYFIRHAVKLTDEQHDYYHYYQRLNGHQSPAICIDKWASAQNDHGRARLAREAAAELRFSHVICITDDPATEFCTRKFSGEEWFEARQKALVAVKRPKKAEVGTHHHAMCLLLQQLVKDKGRGIAASRQGQWGERQGQGAGPGGGWSHTPSCGDRGGGHGYDDRRDDRDLISEYATEIYTSTDVTWENAYEAARASYGADPAQFREEVGTNKHARQQLPPSHGPATDALVREYAEEMTCTAGAPWEMALQSARASFDANPAQFREEVGTGKYASHL